jgi:putative transposase
LIQRGTNQQPLFRGRPDYERMLTLLQWYAPRYGMLVHAYVLMGNHFHLLATPDTGTGMSSFMQALGRSYVRYFNDTHGREGTLWQGRYRATVIDSERYLFTCMAYIELNPLRAGIAASADQYPWSSHLHNAGKRVDPLIDEHPLYWQLGNTPFAREAAYQAIVQEGVGAQDRADIVEATNKGWALVEMGRASSLLPASTRRYAPLKKGRPRHSVPT